jgi:hypothetical protein
MVHFPVMPPTVLQALSRGASAVMRSGWLGAVGLLVSIVRSLLLLPAQIFAVVMLQLAAASWIARHGGVPLPGAAAHGIQVALGSARFLSIAAGLWLAAVLLAAALRVAYLAGALPTLGAELAGARSPQFARGFVRGFVALLPTAVIAFFAELFAAGALAALVLAAGLSATALFTSDHGGLAVAAIAASLAGGLLLYSMVSALCEAALCRAALRGEGPGNAFGRAAIRFGHRPAAFLVVGILATVIGTMLGGSADALGALGAGAAAAQISPWLAVGPQLMVAALAALLAAFVELWRLASTAVLACHDAPRASARGTGAVATSV